MRESNLEAATVFSMLSGQVHTHSIQGKSKDDYETWTVLRYDSIYYCLQFLQIPKSHWKNLFRKLLIICDVAYNDKHIAEYQNDTAKLQNMLGTLRNLPTGTAA